MRRTVRNENDKASNVQLALAISINDFVFLVEIKKVKHRPGFKLVYTNLNPTK